MPFFAVSLSRWGRVLRLPVGKVTCYSSSSSWQSGLLFSDFH